MKKLLALAVTSLLIGTVPISGRASLHAPSDKEGVRDRFVGAWRLAWLEQPSADGKVQRADCTGLLVYTRDGHMSVQVMYRNPQPSSTSAPVQYAQGGYEASFGRYEVDDAHTFTFHVQGALVRTLVGKNLKRVYELSRNQLIVKSPDPSEHWRAAWERY
jgi:hypothetical protein